MEEQVEIWRPIPGFENMYEASNTGKIKSYRKKTPVILKQQSNGKGWMNVALGRNNRFRVHRLIWLTFNGPIPENLEINHKDEDPSNNNLNNLELLTHKDNCNYGHRNDKTRKSVLQFDKKGQLIEEYQSITQIVKKYGYSAGNISSCCTGRISQAYGFIWRFKNPDD